ncbi:MAG: hypothetical protein ACLQLH_16615 [Terracidiphilus sp.]
MKHHSPTRHAIQDFANLCAEDGYRVQDRQRSRHIAILVPVLLFAIIAILILLLCHPALGQTEAAGSAGCAKQLQALSVQVTE